MHVTLISADDETWASGLRSISATLREAGHQTTMIFAGTAEVPLSGALIREIAALAAPSGIIGVSSMSRGSGRAKELLYRLRPLGKLLVWGGMYPTLHPEDCAGHADLICRGEGELFMLELVRAVERGGSWRRLRNAAYLAGETLVRNELRPLIAELDSLPLPDYSFDREYRLERGGLRPHYALFEADRVLYSGARGCVNDCSYCSNSQLKAIYRVGSRYLRRKSVPALVDDLKRCLGLFPKLRRFYFTDEDFLARSAAELEQFAELYPRVVGRPFEAMAAPPNITEEKVALAVKAGMDEINVGLESGSERTRREVFRRFVTDELQLRAAAVINRHRGLRPTYFLILGNPYEQRQDLLDSIRLLRRLPPPFTLRAYNLVFIPGTRLFNQACDDGVIAGLADCAHEINFLAGFDHLGYPWKQKNLYLDSLTSLMVGSSTRLRMGALPRFLIPPLTSGWLVEQCYHRPGLGRTAMLLSKISTRFSALSRRPLARASQ